MTASAKPCRHCRTRAGWCPRGLCWRDYHDAAVRALYPPQNKGRRPAEGDGDFNGGYRPPPVPTAALPGTEEKLTVLESRVAAQVSLWHPADGRA